MTERRKLGGIYTSVYGGDTQKHQKYINKPLETKLNTLNNQLQRNTAFSGSEIPLLLYQWESDDCK